MSTASHSGHSHSGHSHSGHSHSGNAMADFAGLDAYAGFAATGLLADGMLHSREANVGAKKSDVPQLPGTTPMPTPLPPRDPTYYKAWMNYEFPAVDQTGHMARWAPHIRGHILEFELLSGVRFAAPGTGGGAAPKDSATLTTDSGVKIAEIIRPKINVFGRQVEEVMGHAILREDRMAEILTQVVPPTAYFASVLGLSEQRTRYTLELLHCAQRFAMLVLMRFKHALACPRPFEYSPLVQPLLDTPPFSALPSGHATESYMVAGVIRHLAQQRQPKAGELSPLDKQMQALAARISTNRVVAGLHFPIDSIAGRMLGETLAEYFAHVCLGSGKPPAEPAAPKCFEGWVPRIFDGDALKGDERFDPFAVMDGAGADGPFHKNKTPREPRSGGERNPLAHWLWEKAEIELTEMGFI